MSAAVELNRGPWLVPAEILAEVSLVLESRFVTGALTTFLGDLVDGEFSLVCGDGHLPRVVELVDRHADLPRDSPMPW